MKFDLKEFLLTGKLGPIHCGFSQRDMVDHFGEPFSKRNFYNSDGSIREVRFYYDALLLAFEGEKLAQYGLWMDDGDELPGFFDLVGYFPAGGEVPMERFLEYMRSEQIPFRKPKPNEFDYFKVFTEGNVGVGASTRVICFSVACPGTERWRVVTDRESFRIQPPWPHHKP